jgi:RPA family protein
MQERMTAVRASISDVVNGEFRDEKGNNHVISPFGVELRRVSLVGFVVGKYHRDTSNEGKRLESITLDDGSNTIRITVWGEEEAALLEGVKENILALVIGKIKRYKDEVYIAPEIVRELKDSNFMGLHLMQRYQAILTRSGVTLPVTDDNGQQLLTPSSTTAKAAALGGVTKQILSYIVLNAAPEGVHMKDIVAYFEGKGHKSGDIQLKVINLADDELIYEVSISRYLPVDS